MTEDKLIEGNQLKGELESLKTAKDKVIKTLKELDLESYSFGYGVELKLDRSSCYLDKKRLTLFLQDELECIIDEIESKELIFKQL